MGARKMNRAVLREAMAALVVLQETGRLPCSQRLRRELDRSSRDLADGRPHLPDDISVHVAVAHVRLVALHAHHRAQAIAQHVDRAEAYWLALMLDPQGSVAAVLALTLVRGWRDHGLLARIADEWMASHQRVRDTLRAHPELTVDEAERLNASDPTVADHEEHVFGRALVECGLAA